MKYIDRLDLKFDPIKLEEEALQLYNKYRCDQINLRKPGDLDDKTAVNYGSGSLFKDGRVFDSESRWDTFIHDFNQYYVVDVIKQVEQLAGYVYSARVGRARLMRLQPKSCLTYHVDRDGLLRFHVPIITNTKCFFVNDDVVGRMQEEGRLYAFNSNVPHTAVNASREQRIHLVINCYRQ